MTAEFIPLAAKQEYKKDEGKRQKQRLQLLDDAHRRVGLPLLPPLLLPKHRCSLPCDPQFAKSSGFDKSTLHV
jgi:hypothetical protein